MDAFDPLGIHYTEYTPSVILAEPPGIWTTIEVTPAGTRQTASYLDDALLSVYPAASPTVLIPVAGECGETHEVVYGNVGLGSITACKIFDRNGNGQADEGEPGVPGWQMELTGVDVRNKAVGPIVQVTGAEGCTTFADLLPGTYTVTEILPQTGGWIATGDTFKTFTIESSIQGSTVVGGSESVDFTNVCFETADFDTKGYWHNKNGLTELTQADIDYANSLSPYSSESEYFDDGDEPFDGTFTNGDPVEAAIGDGIWQGEEIAPAGSAKAEVSQFLVDRNAGASAHYHREQLAQQLLAFIFNVRHRLDCPDAAIEYSGDIYDAQQLIDLAIAAWSGDDTAAMTAMSSLLDALNNSDELPVVPCYACPVVY